MDFHDILLDIIRKSVSPLEPLETGIAPKIEPLSGIRAILFDIYGTLLISEVGDISLVDQDGNGHDREGSGTAEILERAGYTLLRKDAGKKALDLYLNAISAEHARLRLVGVDYPEVDIRDIWKRVLSILKKDRFISGHTDYAGTELLALYYELSNNKIWPMPGAVELLSRLSALNYPLGIVSNAQFYTPPSLTALLGENETALGFDEALLTYSYRMRRAKPSPLMFNPNLEILKSRYGIAPEEVLYIGNDMRNDVLCAGAAGCRTLLFAGDRRSLRLRKDVPECRDLQPDGIITGLDQVLAILTEKERRKVP